MDRKYYLIIDRKTDKTIITLFKQDFSNPFYQKYIIGIINKDYTVKVY